MGIFTGVLFAADFDHTITAMDGSIPEKNLDAIRAFVAEGGVFSPAAEACRCFGKRRSFCPSMRPAFCITARPAMITGRKNSCSSTICRTTRRKFWTACARSFPTCASRYRRRTPATLTGTTPCAMPICGASVRNLPTPGTHPSLVRGSRSSSTESSADRNMIPWIPSRRRTLPILTALRPCCVN